MYEADEVIMLYFTCLILSFLKWLYFTENKQHRVIVFIFPLNNGFLYEAALVSTEKKIYHN